VLLAMVVAAGASGCSDDDGSYDFNGVWAYSEKITAQRGGRAPFTGEVTIEQNGRFISLLLPGQQPAEGLCDPENATFTAQLYLQDGRAVCSYRGQSVGDDTLSGTADCASSADGSWASLAWSAHLIRR
jgi:hypothetical protein